MSADVIAFRTGPTVLGDGHPELNLLTAGQLLEFKRYYLWRLDSLFLLALSDQPWFDHGDRQDYHKKQLSEELAFCESCIRSIENRLQGLGL